MLKDNKTIVALTAQLKITKKRRTEFASNHNNDNDVCTMTHDQTGCIKLLDRSCDNMVKF